MRESIGDFYLNLCFLVYNSNIKDGMVEMGVQEADMAADLTLRMLNGDEVEQIVPGAEESDAYKGVLAALKNMKDS